MKYLNVNDAEKRRNIMDAGGNKISQMKLDALFQIASMYGGGEDIPEHIFDMLKGTSPSNT